MPAPVNDDFGSATDLGSVLSGTVTGSNVGATLETGEPALGGAGDSTATVWWKWTAPASGTAQFTTLGSTEGADGTTVLDTVMDVWTGTSFADLVLVVQNDDGGVDTTSDTGAFPVTAGTVYWIRVYGYTLDPGDQTYVGNITLNWVGPSALSISTPSPLPEGRAGHGYSFSGVLTAIGGSGTYTWTDGGGWPPGITLNAATGEVTGTPTADGVFTVTVTVDDGTTSVSKTFSLTICPDYVNALVIASGTGADGDWSVVDTPWSSLGFVNQRSTCIGDDGTVLLIGGGPSGTAGVAGQLILRSTDAGATWAEVTTPLDTGGTFWRPLVVGLAYSPSLNRWIACIETGDAVRHACMYSDDHGATWTASGALPFTATNSGNLSAPIWTGSYFLVATGTQSNTDPRIAYSADGITWTGFTGTPFDASSIDGSGGFNGMASDGAGTVLAGGTTTNTGSGSQRVLAISYDHGTTWTVGFVYPTFNYNPHNILYLDGTFVVTDSLPGGGFDGTTFHALGVTADGATVTWVDLATPGDWNVAQGVAYRPDTGELLAIGRSASNSLTGIIAIGAAGSGVTPASLALEANAAYLRYQGTGGAAEAAALWVPRAAQWFVLSNDLWTPPCGPVPTGQGGFIGKIVK